MNWAKERFKNAARRRQWVLAAVYGLPLLIGVVGFELLKDRLETWANTQIDEKSGAVMNTLLSFVASDTFAPAALGAFILIWFATFMVLLRKVAPSYAQARKTLETVAAISEHKASPKVPSIEFYDARPSIEQFKNKLRSSRIAWAAWHMGGSAENYNVLAETRFERLILLAPQEPPVSAIEHIMKRPIGHLATQVANFTKTAIDIHHVGVRWCPDVIYSLLTFGDPPKHGERPSDNAWVFVEVFLPGIEADERPSFIVYARERPVLYGHLYQSFEKLWEHSREVVKKTPDTRSS